MRVVSGTKSAHATNIQKRKSSTQQSGNVRRRNSPPRGATDRNMLVEADKTAMRSAKQRHKLQNWSKWPHWSKTVQNQLSMHLDKFSSCACWYFLLNAGQNSTCKWDHDLNVLYSYQTFIKLLLFVFVQCHNGITYRGMQWTSTIRHQARHYVGGETFFFSTRQHGLKETKSRTLDKNDV